MLGDVLPGRHRPHSGRPSARRVHHAQCASSCTRFHPPATRGARCRRRPALPRLPDGGARGARVAQLARQLDLHPCHRRQEEVAHRDYGSWSQYLVKDGRTCCWASNTLVFEGDDMRNLPDDQLITLSPPELIALGLAAPGDVEPGYIVRVPKAYPSYDFTYKANVDTIRRVDRDRGAQERPSGASQRDAQVQQPGPLHVHRHADGGEHVRRGPRHLVGQRRGGVPRGGVDRTGRPGAAAPRRAPRQARSKLAKHAAEPGAAVAVAAVDDPR